MMTQQDVARVLGLTIDQVKYTEHTALRKLKKLFRKYKITRFDLSLFEGSSSYNYTKH